MRSTANIQIDSLIFHILDPRGGQGKVLSETELPLSQNAVVVNYVTTHILNSLHDQQARAASFKVIAPELTSGKCSEIIDGKTSLLDGSRVLASDLYEIIDRDKRIDGGSLGVCMFSDLDDSNAGTYLAILKIDPSGGFRTGTQRDERNRVYVVLEEQPGMLPSTNERLQKCAFIRKLDPRPEYDLMLLDRQKQGTEVSRFFIQDFLGAEFSLDDRERTDRFYRTSMSLLNEFQSVLSSEEHESLRSVMDGAIKSRHVNVPAWLDSLPVPESLQERANELISQNLPDREFDIDPEFGTKLTRKLKFRGDGDLKLEVSAERFRDLVDVQRRQRQDGSAFYEVMITTERWLEAPR